MSEQNVLYVILLVSGGLVLWWLIGQIERWMLRREARKVNGALRGLAEDENGRYHEPKEGRLVGRASWTVETCRCTATCDLKFVPATRGSHAYVAVRSRLRLDLRDVATDALDPLRFAEALRAHGGTMGPDEHDLTASHLHEPGPEVTILVNPSVNDRLREGRIEPALRFERTKRGMQWTGASPKTMADQAEWFLAMYRLASEEALRPKTDGYRSRQARR